MKKITLISLIFLLLGTLAWAEGMDGDVTLKYTGFDNEDSKTKASEYRDAAASAGLILKLKGEPGEQGLFLFKGHFTSEDDQAYGMDYWFGPHAKFTFGYNEFVHNLIHDPLTNQDAAYAPKANTHTDFNPLSEYGIIYSDMNAELDYAMHGYENLKFFLNYRNQHREGIKQARTLSKCANCHVVSMDREIDETTRDIEAGTSMQFGNFRVMASHKTRTYYEDGPTPMHTYMLAEHPTKHVPVFADRVQFDVADGPLPFNQVPDVEKAQNQIRLDYTWDTGDIMTSYTTAEVENETSDIAFDYSAWLARGAQRLGEKTWFTLRLRSYEIDNDDYFVDVVENAAVAGPYVGSTYQEMFPDAEIDFLRQSTMNRSVMDGQAELRWRYSKRGTFRLGYRHLSVDRDDYEVSEGEHETVTGKIYADWKLRIPKSWKLMANLSYSDISYPYANVDGGCSAALDFTPTSSGVDPNALQYWEWQNARMFNLSNQPSERMDLRFSASRPLSEKTHLMFNIRNTDDQNDDLDYSTWERDMFMASAYLNWMPTSTWTWFLGYNHMEDTSEAHVCIPVFDG